MGDFIIDSLADSGNNPIVLHLTWDFAETEQAMRMASRAVGGAERTWNWANFKSYQVPVTKINSAEAFRINGWWQTNDTLAFTLDNSMDVNTIQCRIANTQKPLNTMHRPNKGFWNGGMMLTAIDASSFQGQVFTLDDDYLGLLDQNYNALG